jgi:two-component system, NarL family, sensor kinase
VTVSILDVEQEKIVTVILRDVTERHRMERELRSAHGQLETRVAERTQQLAESVFQLQSEVNLRNQAERSLRELSARILQLQDSERRRIARELHDSTAQVLVAASMNMATVQEHVAATGDGMVAGIIKDTSHLIEQAQSEIRTISYLLHPPLLDELGLASAIDWYARGFSKRSGVQVSFDVAPDLGRLPQEYELTLFRIVQEALTNVHRHSRSRTAQIYLARTQQGIHLEIADQGSGVDGSKLKALDSGGTLGVGVAGMRERVRQLGGTVTMNSNGQGTVIAAHIPVIGESAHVNIADDLRSRQRVTQTAVA